MGLKTKIGMAMATSAAGAAMVVGGSFALFSSYADTTSNSFVAGKLAVTAGAMTEKYDAGSAHINNLAPGDTAQQSFVISNPAGPSTLAEWVALEVSTATGSTPHSIWEDFASSVDNNAGSNGNYHGLSDQAASHSGGGGIYNTADGGDFTSDNHHATWGYTVYLNDNNNVPTSTVLTTVTNKSGNDWTYNHPFQLQPGKTATVVMAVTLPLAAHNDYQGLDGKLSAEVDAVQSRNNWYTATNHDRQNGDAPGTGAWPYSWQPDING
jgi:spore coat-associated protein N